MHAAKRTYVLLQRSELTSTPSKQATQGQHVSPSNNKQPLQPQAGHSHVSAPCDMHEPSTLAGLHAATKGS